MDDDESKSAASDQAAASPQPSRSNTGNTAKKRRLRNALIVLGAIIFVFVIIPKAFTRGGPTDYEIAPEWDVCLASIMRPAAQERIKKLLERGFHKPGDVENRLGYHVCQLEKG